MAEPFDVLVCGALHLDTVVRGRLPRPDETVMGESVTYACGGKGGNQAVAAARAGARTAMIGRVGRDDAGRTLRANLEAAGVDVSAVAIGDERSGMSVAIVEESGEYGAVVVSGANRRITVGDMAPARVVVLQNEVPEAVNAAVATRAREQNATTIWNAAPLEPGGLRLEGLALDGRVLADVVDLLVVNRVEAAAAFGAPVDTAEAAVRLVEAGRSPVGVTCITLGAAGAVIGGPGHARHLPAPPVAVASTHGAGDAFVGVLAARIARGMDVFEAAGEAVAAAARLVAGE